MFDLNIAQQQDATRERVDRTAIAFGGTENFGVFQDGRMSTGLDDMAIACRIAKRAAPDDELCVGA